MSTQTSPLIGLFQLNLVATTSLMGAPTFTMALLVNPSGASVSGHVNIAEAPNPNYLGSASVNVTGSYTETALGNQEIKAIVLNGNYFFTMPPPSIVGFMCYFNAVIHLDENFNGTGTYSWGLNQRVENVPTKEVPTLAVA